MEALSTETTIVLDRKTRALRSGNRWAIQRLRPDGAWDLESAWTGGRRSLLKWCEDNHVAPTREAEAVLSTLPEADGFKDR